MPAPVLYVEDNHDDAFFMQMAFARFPDYQLHWVTDGERALKFLEQNPTPSLVLLDVKLPRVNGFEVLEAVRADPATANLPIVMFTSSDEKKDVDASHRLKANAFLSKPASGRDYLRIITSLFNELPNFSPAQRLAVPGNLLPN